MSNTIKEFEYDSGDFTTEEWYEETDTGCGVDYYGDDNNDTGHIICYEGQTLGYEVVVSDTIYDDN